MTNGSWERVRVLGVYAPETQRDLLVMRVHERLAQGSHIQQRISLASLFCRKTRTCLDHKPFSVLI